MSMRACVRAELLALALFFAGTAQGEESLEAMIVDVSVNRQKRGEFTVYRNGGEFYVKAAELGALGLVARAGARHTVRIDGEDFVALRAFAPQRLALDESRLALEIDLPPPALQKSTYDLSLNRPYPPGAPQGPGAFLNYRLSASDGTGAEPRKLGFANELALRVGGVLGRNEAAVIDTEGSTRHIRYATQLVYDRPSDQLRVVAGDHTAASGELGSTLSLGGLSLSKFYGMTPRFIRQPLAGYAGAASTPTQVEVRMGGIPVFREQVPAGPFELKNLQQFAGARDVEIVMRDALGREQTIAFPYYFSDHALRAGLHEYSYSLGALREDLGVHSNHYGSGAATALHRYGLNDRVTVGVRGEAAPGLWNLGPTALYRSDRLGVFSASLSASEHDSRDGHAWSLGQVYQRTPFGLYWNTRRTSEDYAVVQDLVAPAGVNAENAIGGSLAVPRFGSLHLDRTVTRRASQDSAATRLGYTYDLGRRGALFVTLARVQEARRDTQAFIGLLLNVDRTKSAHLSARHSRASGDTMMGAQFSQAVPAGEGLGYRFGYDGIANAEASDFHGFAQYNARAASLTLEGAAARTSVNGAGDSASRYEVALAGAAAWAGGRFGLTRQIEDSFVAVQLAAPLEGVRVYSNNQEVGRTDREGRLIVPNVGSFNETQIAIDEADVPLDHAIGALRRVVVPAYRSGSLLTFDVRRVRAVEGRLFLKRRPAEHALVRVGGQEVMTGRDGRYYIEDLPPGRHEANLGDCRFFIDVPQSDEPVAALADVMACE